MDAAVSHTDGAQDEHTRALALVRRHGRASSAFQTLASGLSYFFDGDDAFVAYADTGAAWVAAGPPVAPEGRVAEVAERFARKAREAGRRVRYFGVGAGFAERVGLASLPVGEEPLWDPQRWPEVLRSVRSLREQLRRARAKGVSTRVLDTAELGEGAPLRSALEALGERWLASRRMAPMGFLVQLDPFRLAGERLYIVAERDGAVMELLVASPIPAADGWLVEHVLRDPAAPNGTTELLIDALMHHAADRGAHRVSLGLAPLSGEVPRPLRLARRLGRPFYNFEGLRRFKAKLRPGRWETHLLAFPEAERGVVATLDALHAFADGGYARFAARTVLHLWRPITWVLALLLVPWTVMLALAPASWFPSAAVQQAWALFDVALVDLMLALIARWRRGLAGLLAALTGIDAALTGIQAALYNAPRATTPLEHLVVVLSILAPTTAFAFFTALARSPSPP
ncbi:MAG: phosphatidylglycerol lysyltransferase domain-containing protein [Polyangiales bacterium]